jgi:hypothetical protein
VLNVRGLTFKMVLQILDGSASILGWKLVLAQRLVLLDNSIIAKAT